MAKKTATKKAKQSAKRVGVRDLRPGKAGRVKAGFTMRPNKT